jgi:hypothetical protein
VTYRGKASHAAGFPWEGVNALDAAVMAYTSISCLRQQMKPDWRIHGDFLVKLVFNIKNTKKKIIISNSGILVQKHICQPIMLSSLLKNQVNIKISCYNIKSSLLFALI